MSLMFSFKTSTCLKCRAGVCHVCLCLYLRVYVRSCATTVGWHVEEKMHSLSFVFFQAVVGWWTLTVLIAKKQLFLLKLIFKPVPVRPFLRVLHTHNMEKLMQESAPLKILVIFFLFKGAGSFHIHRKTMKDLWILAVLGVREQPNLAHNLVTHRH